MKLQTLIHILIGIICIGLLPGTQAVVPAPDGGYPGGNTAEGQNALFRLTAGGYNTAVGWYSLFANTTGFYNTAVGAGALDLNTGDNNTGTGAAALLLNTTGLQNTANGAFALFSNTEGSYNTATGDQALFSNTTGNLNTANGATSLFSNTTGTFNTAVGRNALFSNITGILNTAVGFESLTNNTAGSDNVALGHGAGLNVTTASNVICLGADGADVNNSCFIGNVRGVTTANADAIPVLIDSDGQLGTAGSSRRFKKEIKPMESASEVILGLKPVTFHYKNDKTDTPQFGLIAEEVANVNPDLVVRDKDSEIYTVRYDAVNAMLLNEFLKEHKKIKDQQANIAELKSAVAQQKKDFQATVAQFTARLDEQASQIQKASAQLEASKPAPRVVNNNQ
jgi:hypothetical protein